MENITGKKYCGYLRKSRKDLDAEARGEGETLSRHKKQLEDFSQSLGIKIEKFYQEIVSGETIASRPVVQQLLTDVENGMWNGVFVVEVERLARGNTLDQGIVSNAFQFSDTKIITPLKTYDPNNECDEEYFEFGLFMSRREYKKINQRLHNGIIASIKEGKHVSAPPFGYDKYKLPKQKGFSLKINPAEAKVVQYIFSSYVQGVGIVTLCNKLNSMGIKPKRSTSWGKSSISHILNNPVYIGKIRYVDKATKKKNVNGQIIRVKNDEAELIYIDALHEPIIDMNTWQKVQDIKKNNLINRTKVDYTLKNSMASILKCGICGRTMQRITNNKRNDVRIFCKNCRQNVGSNIDFVEKKLIQALQLLLKDYTLDLSKNDTANIDNLLIINSNALEDLQNQLFKYQSQLNNVYDFLEQGIYSKEVFIERSETLKKQIDDIKEQIKNLEEEKSKILHMENASKNFIPKLKNVIDCYYEANTIEQKNILLKSILNKVEYTKINPKNKEDFQLKLFPKLY